MKILRSGEREFLQFISDVEGRLTRNSHPLEKRVRSIIEGVKKHGDQSLLRYTQAFDQIHIPLHQLQIERREIREAYQKIPKDFIKTLKKATHRIRKFHQLLNQKMPSSIKEEKEGIRLEQLRRPLEKVGIYVPGGKASYPSTVLMAAIPAKVAGVREVLMVTPPQKEGINPAVLVAADLAGVDRIYRVGGVQAIAALAYGTESIPKVDKIVGPGNQYVATAKRLVYGEVDIDMIAGPSEIVIVSDGNTAPSFIAADLISQAEHDEMAMAILITPSENFAREVNREVDRQLAPLKRASLASSSLRQRGALLVVKDLEEAVGWVNRIAPEHLELAVTRPLSVISKVKHAGAVFLGDYTPEAIGDYMAGPNHILPTGGAARFASPLGPEDFFRKMNLMAFTPKALKRFERDIKRFTEWEGLEGHYRSVQIRMRGPKP